jgi:hypothetical protein
MGKIVCKVACLIAVVAVGVIVFRHYAHHRQVDYGDVPTWLAFAAAAIAGFAALWQLRSQQREISRQAKVLERQQATAVTLGYSPGAFSTISGPLPGPEASLSVVFADNGSARPIRNVACRIKPANGDWQKPWNTGNYWPAEPQVRLKPILEQLDIDAAPAPVVLGGRSVGFLFEYVLQKDTSLKARFTDDEGSYWEIDDLMHLTMLKNRDDW